jgi:predicted ATPase
MRIKRAFVRNFRGVKRSELSELGDLVVLAGQNGSGKSCMLDAIRLLKSVYGGYQPNEFHQWFGEFQINFSNDPRAFVSLFNNVSEPLVIEIDFEIHEEERNYLKQNADALITDQAWRVLVPELYGWRSLTAAPFTAQFRGRESEVAERATKDKKIFTSEIDLPFITASVFITQNNQPQFNPSKVLELIFSNFDLAHLGIIDYHGPHRMYGREVLNNINVNIEALEEQRKQSALYNYNTKYTNVKSEMASLYVREALAQKAGNQFNPKSNVTDTLKELFATFFPEKEFLGPQPTADGSLRFPVKIGGQETHDLDELSSGEKEILYGYLRLRNSAPKNSVILLDEPELHLNPRLTRNLPSFYYRHLAKALGNQVWLVTHSDAILRESVGRRGFSVFHITPSAYSQIEANQATHIQAEEDLEKAVIELVGDLAAYNPGGRIVIFEGDDSDFDLRMASELFRELPEKANLISGTNKSRVRGLHALLQRLSDSSKLPAYRVYSITDKDSEPDDLARPVNRFNWDVYHIENYLLEPKYILSALSDLLGGKSAMTESRIDAELMVCAGETIPSLVAHAMSQRVNQAIISSINTKINPSSSDIVGDMSFAIATSKERMVRLADAELSQTALLEFVNKMKSEFQDDLRTGRWRKTFRGRDVLRRFVGKHADGLKYDLFRNLVISRMRDDEFRPAGMAEILNNILAPHPLKSHGEEVVIG